MNITVNNSDFFDYITRMLVECEDQIKEIEKTLEYYSNMYQEECSQDSFLAAICRALSRLGMMRDDFDWGPYTLNDLLEAKKRLDTITHAFYVFFYKLGFEDASTTELDSQLWFVVEYMDRKRHIGKV